MRINKKTLILITLDTIKINGDSHFATNLKVASLAKYYLVLDRRVTINKDNLLSFFAEFGKVTIESFAEFYSLETKIADSKIDRKFFLPLKL